MFGIRQHGENERRQKMKNKVLSCLLMLCLLITTAPSMAWADLNEGGGRA